MSILVKLPFNLSFTVTKLSLQVAAGRLGFLAMGSVLGWWAHTRPSMKRTKRHAAVYVERHSLPQAVSEAIDALCHAEPEDPLEWLAQHFTDKSSPAAEVHSTAVDSRAPATAPVAVASPLPKTPASSDDSWCITAWLAGLDGLQSSLAAALLSGGECASANELDFVRGLSCSADAVYTRLSTGGALEKLSRCLADALAQLQQQETATAEELQDKFMLDGNAFTLQLGGIETFYGGLEGIVGAPETHVEAGMVSDHCRQADSSEPWGMPNYKTTTTSKVEWLFVANPLEGADEHGASFSPYPTKERSRQPRPFDFFEAELQKRNRLLAELGEPPVGRMEFFATRLYTGPVPLATPRAHTLCMACTG